MEEYCKEQCTLGDQGHCGRTKFEYESHCEKRNNNGEEQRKRATLDQILNK